MIDNPICLTKVDMKKHGLETYFRCYCKRFFAFGTLYSQIKLKYLCQKVRTQHRTSIIAF